MDELRRAHLLWGGGVVLSKPVRDRLDCTGGGIPLVEISSDSASGTHVVLWTGRMFRKEEPIARPYSDMWPLHSAHVS